jgi:hypothetical protein
VDSSRGAQVTAWDERDSEPERAVSIAGTAISRWVLDCLLKIGVLYETDVPNINFHIGPHWVPSPLPQVRVYFNSVDLVRKRAIPTERPPLVGEVSAKFCG